MPSILKLLFFEFSVQFLCCFSFRKICAEAKLLIATYNDSTSNVNTDVNIQHYKEAMEMFREWEKSLVSLAQYYDRIFQNFTDEERDSKGSDMQIHMINYFGKSLQYGTTYVYQSMPRLLSIWFDYGTRLLNVSVSSVKYDRKSTLLKMTKLIDSFLGRLPSFVFFTAFSQLVSRICHPQKEVSYHTYIYIWGTCSTLVKAAKPAAVCLSLTLSRIR